MTTPEAPSEPVCPLGISARTLSALHDGAMSQARIAHLDAHAENCPACGARLATFDSLADILRSERPIEPDERLWQAIVTAAGSPSRLQHQRFSGTGRAYPSWGRLSALVAVLLLTVGFVALFAFQRPTMPGQRTPTATTLPATEMGTSTSTATPQPPLPAHPLNWQPLSVSTIMQPIAFANDGESAYRCAVGSDAHGNAVLNIWHTSDRGAHWIAAREIPNDPSINLCSLVVDVSDPSVAALAWVPRGGGAGDSYTGLMTTADGGITWQAVPSQPFIRIDQLDSRGGVIYAIRETVGSSNSVEYHLWASSDRMRSWQQVDHGLLAAAAGFWLQPDGTSILLIISGGANGVASQLVSSPDGGATWHQLNVSGGLPSYRPARFANSGAYPGGIVARWLQGQFHICVSNSTIGTSTPSGVHATCSADGGASWHMRTMLPLTTEQGSFIGANLIAITNDGSLLASGLGTLYRLGATADRWESLGPQPELVVYYCPSPGAGMLWATPAGIGDPVDPKGRVFTASYMP